MFSTKNSKKEKAYIDKLFRVRLKIMRRFFRLRQIRPRRRVDHNRQRCPSVDERVADMIDDCTTKETPQVLNFV